MKVSLISKTVFETKDKSMVDTLANIARVCTEKSNLTDIKKMSSEVDNNSFDRVIKLMWDGHLSVFEFFNFTFLIKDISVVCLKQLTRHRMCSFMVKSGRYVKETPDSSFWNKIILPESILNLAKSSNKKQLKLWTKIQNYLKMGKEIYLELLEEKILAEDARYLLSQGIPLDMLIHVNLRELLFVLYKLRVDKHSQAEARQVVLSMFNQLIKSVDKNMQKFLKEFVEYITYTKKVSKKSMYNLLQSSLSSQINTQIH